MRKKVRYCDIEKFLDFCYQQLGFSRKDLVIRCRAKDYAAKRVVISLLLCCPDYFDLGPEQTSIIICRDRTATYNYMKRHQDYYAICDDIWKIWNGEADKRSVFFDFESPKGSYKIIRSY